MEIEIESDQGLENCRMCNYENSLKDSIPDYKFCNNCFHISKSCTNTNTNKNKDKDQSTIKKNSTINRIIPDFVKNFFISKISEIKLSYDNNYKILVINDNDSNLLDTIRNVVLENIDNKYKVKTFSVSPYYNNSYFSKHKHYKLSLSEYTYKLLKQEHESFNLIILNDILTYSEDPIKILEYCKDLSDSDTKILCCNLSTKIVHSVDLLNMNKGVTNIFNTNSLSKCCSNAGLFLQDTEIIVENLDEDLIERESVWIGSDISLWESIKLNTSEIYNEICYDLYSSDVHKYIRLYWLNYFSKVNDDLKKYRNVGYNIVCVGDNRIMDMYVNFTNDVYINKISDKIDNVINNKTDNIVIILDYKNINNVRSDIIKFSKMGWLIYDTYNLIGYNFENWKPNIM